VAQVWDATTFEPAGPPLKHLRGVKTVVFSPDCQRLATGGADGAVRLWDRATGELIGPPIPSGQQIHYLSFSPDGNSLMVVRANLGPHTSAILPVEADAQPTSLLKDTSHVAAGMRIDEDGGLDPLSPDEIYALSQSSQTGSRTVHDVPTNIRWHRAQAQASELATNWFAVRFHLDRLLALEPDNADLRQRRTRAATSNLGD
jgi:WD40 repeat protein